MAKVAMDLEAMKAVFAANGGEVTRVGAGVRAIESDKTIYRAMREGERAVADSVLYTRKSESRWETQVGAYHAARADGWSYENAMEYAATAIE